MTVAPPELLPLREQGGEQVDEHSSFPVRRHNALLRVLEVRHGRRSL